MILTFSRDQIVALADMGLMNKKKVLHYDVCKALKQGKTAEKIAEEFNLAEPRHVWYIRDHNCPDCKR